jgi:hypothetical protein
MGWSESYYQDMKREAREVLGSRAGPLLEEVKVFHNILMDYGDFIDSSDEIESLLLRLEGYLAEYRIDE